MNQVSPRGGALLQGFMTGMLLQLSIGPVFFFILNLTLTRGTAEGLWAVIAVTLVDGLFILMALMGVDRLLQKEKTRVLLSLAGALVLLAFGVKSLHSILYQLLAHPSGSDPSTLQMSPSLGAFGSAFLLTLSNPLTILFWTGLFGLKSAELQLSPGKLALFGLGACLGTPLFLGTMVLGLSPFIPQGAIPVLNILVSLVLIFYGLRGIGRHFSR